MRDNRLTNNPLQHFRALVTGWTQMLHQRHDEDPTFPRLHGLRQIFVSEGTLNFDQSASWNQFRAFWIDSKGLRNVGEC